MISTNPTKILNIFNSSSQMKTNFLESNISTVSSPSITVSLSVLAGASACTNKMPRSFNTIVRAPYPKSESGMPPPPRNCLATEYVVFIIAEIKAAARDVYQIKSPALHTNQKRAGVWKFPRYIFFCKIDRAVISF